MSRDKNIFLHFIEQSWLLLLCSFLFGLMIALASAAWSPRIKANETAEFQNLIIELMPDANKSEVILSQLEITKTSKTDVLKAEDANGRTTGFVFTASGAGYSGEIKLVIALDSTCDKILGYSVLQCTDSVGFGDRIDIKKDRFFASQFKGAPATSLQLLRTGGAETVDSQIVAISGATISSSAVVDIFNNYINTVKEALKQKGLISNGQ